MRIRFSVELDIGRDEPPERESDVHTAAELAGSHAVGFQREPLEWEDSR